MKRGIPFLWIAAIYGSLAFLPQTPIWQLQSELHWNYIGHILFFLPPLVGLLLNRRKVDLYGLRTDRFAESAKVGLVFAALLITFPLAADIAFGTLTLRPELRGQVAQSLFYFLVMVGVAEELLFRGYFQGELNAQFTKRYRFLGASITHGFGITVVVFTACHMVPGVYMPAAWEMVYVFGASILFGLLREWTQSLAAPILAHFGLLVHRYLFGMSLPAGVATAIAWFLAFWFLAKTLEKRQTT
ncbi:MAG: CPBP family intramembrane metalloprotease [Candidatus Hydrogenedentes bacterium]|nr:CPBP family intramembrane metalloprotease [Candidatus Hydrogenedentota bacterium]